MAAATGGHPAERSSSSARAPMDDERLTTIVAAARRHLPPPMAGYTFQRHLRSTLSHDTFAAERRSDADESATERVVVRVYALDHLKRHEERRNMVEREVLVGCTARHPNVAEALPAFATKTDLYAVERYYGGGELFEFVESYHRSGATVAPAPSGGGYGGLPLDTVRRIFGELMTAVDYLHNRLGLAHRNIKLENILLDEANHVRLSGLGMCAVIAPREGKDVGQVSLRLCCGSKHYVAPELLEGHAYDGAAVDVWAAGVVLFALVCGCFPFDGGDDALFEGTGNAEAVLEAHAAFQGLPDPQVQDLLRGTLRTNARVRLSVAEVLEHPFLRAAR